jgi:hypothetical protein
MNAADTPAARAPEIGSVSHRRTTRPHHRLQSGLRTPTWLGLPRPFAATHSRILTRGIVTMHEGDATLVHKMDVADRPKRKSANGRSSQRRRMLSSARKSRWVVLRMSLRPRRAWHAHRTTRALRAAPCAGHHDVRGRARPHENALPQRQGVELVVLQERHGGGKDQHSAVDLMPHEIIGFAPTHKAKRQPIRLAFAAAENCVFPGCSFGQFGGCEGRI